MSLANIEHSFLLNLTQPRTDGLDFMSNLNVVGSLSVEKQLFIYRSNVTGAHQKVLAQVYPACFNILGEEYFNQLCFVYRIKYPSTQPDLNMYGEKFSTFLVRQIIENEELNDFDYLVELAKLEWHWHNSFFSDNDTVFDFEGLALIHAEDHARLHFLLSDSFSLHSTSYPLIDIWKENTGSVAQEQDFSMLNAECYFCISRAGLTPELEVLSQKQHEYLRLIINKSSLIELGEFGLQDELITFIEKGWVTGFLLDG